MNWCIEQTAHGRGDLSVADHLAGMKVAQPRNPIWIALLSHK